METGVLLSKSAFTTGNLCRLASCYYVLNRENAKPIENELVLISGKEFGRAAAISFGADATIEFNKDRYKMVEETKTAIEIGIDVIAEASFIWNGLFCSVDIFKLNDDGTVTFYEVKSGSEVKEIYERDIAFTYVVLSGLGYEIKDAYLAYANGEYSFNKGEEIDYDQLFVVENYTDRCIELSTSVKAEIEEIKTAIISRTLPEREFSSSCNSPYKCPFMDFCIKEEKMPEKTSIFYISGAKMSTKLKWYANGMRTFEDVKKLTVSYKKTGEPKDATWKYVQQATCFTEQKDGEVKKEKLGEFLNKIEFPLASFDYEGFATAIPRYYGVKPSQQVVFQYSYDYIEYEGAPIQHFDFLAESKGDPREALCKALSKLPKAKSILVWNKAYEAARNSEMAELVGFESFKELLLEMNNNFVDLMVPFRERVIVPWKANGSYSLKPITESLTSLKYHDMKIHNGTEAAEAFIAMQRMSCDNKKETCQLLKLYNNQDTYAPLKILEQMFRIYKEDNSFVLFAEGEHYDVSGKLLQIGNTVATNKGIGVIMEFKDVYAKIMIMNSSEVIYRMPKKIVYIQDLISYEADRSVSISGKLNNGDLVATDLGMAKVYGRTMCFIRVKRLEDGIEYLRMEKNLKSIQALR